MIEGSCDTAFAAVREVFADSLADGDDLGAAVSVYVDGRCVVDLWGGAGGRAYRAGRGSARPRASRSRARRRSPRRPRCCSPSAARSSLDARVIDWWPEFGAHGKDATTGEHLLTHQAGLPAFDRPVSLEEAADPAAMAGAARRAGAAVAPGTAHGYHALTFGWLVGELVRRHAGQTVGEFVRAEISRRTCWSVCRPEMLGALARISAGRPAKLVDAAGRARRGRRAGRRGAGSGLADAAQHANPAASFNKPALLTAGWPAAGLVCTARALADFYRRLVAGHVLRPDTVRDAVRERVRGPDRTLVTETAFGLGFMRAVGKRCTCRRRRAAARSGIRAPAGRSGSAISTAGSPSPTSPTSPAPRSATAAPTASSRRCTLRCDDVSALCGARRQPDRGPERPGRPRRVPRLGRPVRRDACRGQPAPAVRQPRGARSAGWRDPCRAARAGAGDAARPRDGDGRAQRPDAAVGGHRSRRRGTGPMLAALRGDRCHRPHQHVPGPVVHRAPASAGSPRGPRPTTNSSAPPLRATVRWSSTSLRTAPAPTCASGAPTASTRIRSVTR